MNGFQRPNSFSRRISWCAGDEVILAEQQQVIAHVPGTAPGGAGGLLVRTGIRLGEAVRELTQFWQVFRLARGEQGQPLDESGPVGRHGFLFEHLDGTIENAFGFLAVPWRSVAVGAHHLEFDLDVLRFAFAPDDQRQGPAGLLGLGLAAAQAALAEGIRLFAKDLARLRGIVAARLAA